MLRRIAALAALVAFGSVDAHATTSMRAYPSLAKRPVEDQEDSVPAESAPVAVAPADPALAGALPAGAEALVAQGRRGAAAFDRTVSGARNAVSRARGSQVSSEAWVQAQMQISMLDSARYDSVAALAGIDTLYVSTMSSGAGVSMAMEQERGALAGLVDGQNDTLDAMRRSLAQP